MKLLYIALCDLKDSGQTGIKKKIENQLQCFRKEFDIYSISQANWFFCVYHENKLIEKKILLSFEEIYNYIYCFIKKNNIDCVYIRYLRTNLWMNTLLKKIKRLRIKVILEFPTIPYDLEIKNSAELDEDIYFRKKLKKYANMSTNYNGLNNVFGIPSIPLQNGINLDAIPVKKEGLVKDGINLIAVATMNYWHGYDRLIRGIANYYNENKTPTKVYLKLIGNGSQINNYENLIRQNNLGEYIKLTGAKYGEELDREFDRAHIAVGTLGMYRNNADQASPIKTKEYCARGMPMVLGHKDLAFNEKLPFILNVPNDDSDIDIERIIQFYNQYKENCSSEVIRHYAEENLTWDNILRPVKEYFNS